jgi:tetratricopeptide (TPR) repeat protein
MAVIPIVVLAALLSQQPETLSLLGEPLYAPSLPKAERATAEAALATARAAYQKAPSDPATVIAYEQANLALGRVGDALEILTHGLESHPDDARLLLERGRSYIRIRKFEVAARDLRKASASLPAAKCTLAFALYLSTNYAAAHETYRGCGDPDVFGYLAARRAGVSPGPRPTATGAAPAADTPIRLPGSTARRGEHDAPQPIAARYMTAVERLLDGDSAGATDQLKKIVEKYRRSDWMEPAYIAAEADYAKLYKPVRRKKKG